MSGFSIIHISYNFDRKYLLFLHVRGLFQTKYNLKSFVNFLEVGYFECFDKEFHYATLS
jgi:hypothetical protein